jgi:sugar lactone lactonase YvrE
MTQLNQVTNSLCHLAEGPVWNPADQHFYWTDICCGSLWRFGLASGQVQRFFESDMQIGGFAFTATGQMALCTDKGIFFLDMQTNQLTLLIEIPLASDERFNDITVDAAGRILAGTLKPSFSDGKLYCLEPCKPPRVILEGLGISNGMCFSLDQRYLYHTDSLSRQITRYTYTLETGDISEPVCVYRGLEEDGFPDGITMDSAGQIWIACWGSSKVIRIKTDGTITSQISVPAKQPSSVTFGGSNYQTLFITTSYQGAADPEFGCDEDGNFLGGSCYTCESTVQGLPEHITQFKL